MIWPNAVVTLPCQCGRRAWSLPLHHVPLRNKVLRLTQPAERTFFFRILLCPSGNATQHTRQCQEIPYGPVTHYQNYNQKRLKKKNIICGRHRPACFSTIHNSQDRRSLKYPDDNCLAGTMETSLGRRLGQPNALQKGPEFDPLNTLLVQWSFVIKAMFIEKETSEK